MQCKWFLERLGRAHSTETSPANAGLKPGDTIVVGLLAIASLGLHLLLYKRWSQSGDEGMYISGIIGLVKGADMNTWPIYRPHQCPLAYGLLAACARLFSSGGAESIESVARIAHAAISSLTVPFTYLTARLLAGRGASLTAVLALLCSPGLLFYGTHVNPTSLAVVVFLVAMFLLLVDVTNLHYRLALDVACGVLVVAWLWMRVDAGVYVPVLILVLLLSPARWRRLLAFGAGLALALTAGFLLFPSLWDLARRSADFVAGGVQLTRHSLDRRLGAVLLGAGPALWLTGMAGLVLGLRRGQTRAALPLLVGILIALGFFFPRITTPRYLLPASPMLAWGVALLLEELLQTAKRWRGGAALAIGVVVFVAHPAFMHGLPTSWREPRFNRFCREITYHDDHVNFDDHSMPIGNIFRSLYQRRMRGVPFYFTRETALEQLLKGPLWTELQLDVQEAVFVCISWRAYTAFCQQSAHVADAYSTSAGGELTAQIGERRITAARGYPASGAAARPAPLYVLLEETSPEAAARFPAGCRFIRYLTDYCPIAIVRHDPDQATAPPATVSLPADERRLRDLLSANPDNEYAAARLVNLLDGAGRREDAIDVLRFQLRHASLSTAVRAAGRLGQQFDLWPQALPTLVRAGRRYAWEPTWREAVMAAAQAYRRMGQRQAALRCCRELLARYPDREEMIAFVQDCMGADGAAP